MSSTSNKEPSFVVCKGFTDAKPLFFRWDGKELTATQHINFVFAQREAIGMTITDKESFLIGGESPNQKPSGFPFAVLTRNGKKPTLTFEWGYNGSKHTPAKTFTIEETGLYVTFGASGLVRMQYVFHDGIFADNSQSRFLGSLRLAERFRATLCGHCYNPDAELFQKIGDKIYRYEDNGAIGVQDRLMSLGTAGTISESDELGSEGRGRIYVQAKVLDGINVITTSWQHATHGLLMGLIPIEEDGLYTTVTPEIVLRLATNPAMLFSRLDLIQRYNSVFNADWYKKDEVPIRD